MIFASLVLSFSEAVQSASSASQQSFEFHVTTLESTFENARLDHRDYEDVSSLLPDLFTCRSPSYDPRWEFLRRKLIKRGWEYAEMPQRERMEGSGQSGGSAVGTDWAYLSAVDSLWEHYGAHLFAAFEGASVLGTSLVEEGRRRVGERERGEDAGRVNLIISKDAENSCPAALPSSPAEELGWLSRFCFPPSLFTEYIRINVGVAMSHQTLLGRLSPLMLPRTFALCTQGALVLALIKIANLWNPGHPSQRLFSNILEILEKSMVGSQGATSLYVLGLADFSLSSGWGPFPLEAALNRFRLDSHWVPSFSYFGHMEAKFGKGAWGFEDRLTWEGAALREPLEGGFAGFNEDRPLRVTVLSAHFSIGMEGLSLLEQAQVPLRSSFLGAMCPKDPGSSHHCSLRCQQGQCGDDRVAKEIMRELIDSETWETKEFDLLKTEKRFFEVLTPWILSTDLWICGGPAILCVWLAKAPGGLRQVFFSGFSIPFLSPYFAETSAWEEFLLGLLIIPEVISPGPLVAAQVEYYLGRQIPVLPPLGLWINGEHRGSSREKQNKGIQYGSEAGPESCAGLGASHASALAFREVVCLRPSVWKRPFLQSFKTVLLDMVEQENLQKVEHMTKEKSNDIDRCLAGRKLEKSKFFFDKSKVSAYSSRFSIEWQERFLSYDNILGFDAAVLVHWDFSVVTFHELEAKGMPMLVLGPILMSLWQPHLNWGTFSFPGEKRGTEGDKEREGALRQLHVGRGAYPGVQNDAGVGHVLSIDQGLYWYFQSPSLVSAFALRFDSVLQLFHLLKTTDFKNVSDALKTEAAKRKQKTLQIALAAFGHALTMEE